MVSWHCIIYIYTLYICNIPTNSAIYFDLHGISTPSTYDNLFTYNDENSKSTLEQIMLQHWCSLEDRSKDDRLVMIYKIEN